MDNPSQNCLHLEDGFVLTLAAQILEESWFSFCLVWVRKKKM